MKNQQISLACLIAGMLQGCLAQGLNLLAPVSGQSDSDVAKLTAELDVSNDFDVAIAAPGTTLYSNNSDYVQEINLGEGASVQFLYGVIADPGSSKGAYGGNDPQLERQTLEPAWPNFSNANQGAFCITNGQFFRNDDKSSTGVAFPVKADGKVVSDGYAGDSEYPDEKLMLEVWSDRASIKAFEPTTFYSSDAPNIIVGLKPDADKGINDTTGRTFIGLKDNNANGSLETLLIFTSKSSTQPHAAEVLRYFGASEIMMIDGGGSTQLLCKGTSYISSPRTIPQMIGVVSAP